MRNSTLINRRNKLIYEAYAKLWGEGKREELIWPELSLGFHLEEHTIYRIVLRHSKLLLKNQLQLPFTDNDNDIKQV